MNKRDKTFLQMMKDNAFYLSLGLGLLAVLAVVGVYTAQQDQVKVAENNMDLNVASDYSDLTTQELVEETNGDVAKKEDVVDTTEENISESVTTEEFLSSEEEYVEGVSVDETEISVEEETIPTTVNAGELDFNSEKTITWPINGEVILPYSMETTVHYKTLDQYQCNPGMLIQAGMGTTVKNAYLGQVTDVTSDNTYGNMVTLYIGNGYSIVYGQLDTIYVKEGDFVKAGESVGTVGNPTDSFTEEGSHLFFQMLSGEETVDPMLYIE